MRKLKKGQKTMEPQTVETLQKNSAIYVGKKQKKGEMVERQQARQRMLSSGSVGIRRGVYPRGCGGKCPVAVTLPPLQTLWNAQQLT